MWKLLFLAIALTCTAAAQTVPCFFNTAHNSDTNSYVGNTVTHDNQNKGSHWGTELVSANQGYGNGGFILDGPAFYVSSPCVTNMVSFRVGSASGDNDSLQLHFICQGTGGTNGQGDTVAGSPATAGGKCLAGDSDVQYTNTYDVGVVCVGGGCVYGKMYVNLGPTVYSTFFAVSTVPLGKIVTLFWQQGSTTLPAGTYSIAMGTNCDSGSQPGNPTGGTQGHGGPGCGQLTGEGGAYGVQLGTNTNTWSYGTELFPHKYFTNANITAVHTHCMIYDPAHNNTAGLPPTLTTYDGGGCNVVNTGSVTPGSAATGLPLTGLIPHMVNFAIGYSGS
jgi:hypothetical protein